MIRVGFEPTPFRTSALSWRLRPLGHLTNFGLLLPAAAFKLLHSYIVLTTKQRGASITELSLTLRFAGK